MVMLGRTANGLFWMFRYIERAENIARLVDAGLRMSLTRTGASDDDWDAVLQSADVRSLFAERQDGRLVLRRGFSLEPGERVLVVEDVVTTGGSTRETIDVARAAGATVVGAAAIIDRSGGQQNLDVPFHALAVVSLPTYEPEGCPLCAAGQPFVKPGSRV